MTHLTGSKQANHIQGMFTRIASRYNMMNRLMTIGQDVRWRREVIQRSALPPTGRMLDLGAGTGDLTLEAKRLHPHCRPIAVDFTMAMMRVGQNRSNGIRLDWAAADAFCLPFPDNTFDAVVSGFLLRNVPEIEHALREQYRLLVPGGRIVALDTTQPQQSLASPLINFHLHTLIPVMGKIVVGDADAYTYLPDSTENFIMAEQLAVRMLAAGFQDVGFRRLMVGTVAIHWGVK